MGLYRTLKPTTVDAFQCKEAKTIATDLGFINIEQGQWVVCGEGGETYIVDDEFFRRTFFSLDKNSRLPVLVPDDFRPPLRPAAESDHSLQTHFHRDCPHLRSRLVGRYRIHVPR